MNIVKQYEPEFSAEFAMTLDRYYNYRIKEVFIAEDRDTGEEANTFRTIRI